MTQDEIIEMAQKSKKYAEHITPQGLEWFDYFVENFAALITAAEREACAKLCEDLSKDMTPIAEQAVKTCATLIRARTA